MPSIFNFFDKFKSYSTLHHSNLMKKKKEKEKIFFRTNIIEFIAIRSLKKLIVCLNVV